jgi:galactose mutarotase-like enzyme
MPFNSCSIEESTLRGYRAIVLENEYLSVTVLPEKGAEIYSIFYRPMSFDVLWKAPWGLHKAGAVNVAFGGSEAAWMDIYGGGWQGIFPNGGDACVYAGAALGFHGDASTANWDYTFSQTQGRASLRMEIALPRVPFTLMREVTIESASLTVEVKEEVKNDSDESFPAMWGHHPALATMLLRGARIESSARRYEPHKPETSPTARMTPDCVHPWPAARGKDGTTVDLDLLPVGDERISEMGYLSDFETGQYQLLNPSLGLGVRLSWDKNLFPYLWYWLEWGGSCGYPFYGRCKVAALEPFSSIPGTGLANAVKRGTAIIFAPQERRSTEVSFSLLPVVSGYAENT